MLRGAAAATLTGRLGPGEADQYVLRGEQGQPILLQLDSPTGRASFSLMSQGGTLFVRPGETTAWRGSLPQAGKYYLGVYGGAAPDAYSLSIQLARRIRFKEGAKAATVSGTAPGSIVGYSVFGAKGSRLAATISGTAGKAALSIVGFADGNTYLASSAGKTEYLFTLPLAQEYIVGVNPQEGVSVHYILDVQVD
jgi:hypothetical protein